MLKPILINAFKVYSSHKALVILDYKYFPPSLCDKAIEAELLKKYMLVDSFASIGEDGASIIPCVYHAKSIYILDKNLYYYRYNESSATKRKKVFNQEWPRIVAEHIETHIDINSYDLCQQLHRKTAHDVFSVLVTQFYRLDSYIYIVRSCYNILNQKRYKDSISKCKFRGSKKALLMVMALRLRLFFLIYLYSKF